MKYPKNTEESNPPLEQPSQSNDAAEIAGAAAANSAKVGIGLFGHLDDCFDM